jgi:hypothetical protein
MKNEKSIITRDQIIEAIHQHFLDHPFVYALWLEGADSNNSVDAYSDIDFWLDVEDRYVDSVFKEIEGILTKLSPFDHNSEAELPHPKLRHKIYHLENTSEFLKLDIVIQCHSRDPKESTYIIGDPIESPKVIFDKRNVIRFVEGDETNLYRALKIRIKDLEQTFGHVSVRRCIARGELIEAIAVYHRYVVDPLIELLRIQYTPLHHDYGLVHISRHLPEQIVIELEALVMVATGEKLLTNIHKAEKLFKTTLADLNKDPRLREA